MFFFKDRIHPRNLQAEMEIALKEQRGYFVLPLKEWLLFQVKSGVLDSKLNKVKFAKQFFLTAFDQGNFLEEINGKMTGAGLFPVKAWYRYRQRYNDKDYPTLRSPWVENVIAAVEKQGGQQMLDFWENVIEEYTDVLRAAARMFVVVQKHEPGTGKHQYHRLMVAVKTEVMWHGVPMIMYREPLYPQKGYTYLEKVRAEIDAMYLWAVNYNAEGLFTLGEKVRKGVNSEAAGVRVVGFKPVDFIGRGEEALQLTLKEQLNSLI